MAERTTVRLPDDLIRRAKRTAADDGVSLTALIEEGLRQILDERRNRKKTLSQVPLPVSTATGGLIPGINLDSTAELQEMDDLEYMSRSR
jgi:hypothetical protein